jgi:hypothetical protein
MVAECSSETFGNFLEAHTVLQPKDQHRHLHRRENLKSHKMGSTSVNYLTSNWSSQQAYVFLLHTQEMYTYLLFHVHIFYVYVNI